MLETDLQPVSGQNINITCHYPYTNGSACTETYASFFGLPYRIICFIIFAILIHGIQLNLRIIKRFRQQTVTLRRNTFIEHESNISLVICGLSILLLLDNKGFDDFFHPYFMKLVENSLAAIFLVFIQLHMKRWFEAILPSDKSKYFLKLNFCMYLSYYTGLAGSITFMILCFTPLFQPRLLSITYFMSLVEYLIIMLVTLLSWCAAFCLRDSAKIEGVRRSSVRVCADPAADRRSSTSARIRLQSKLYKFKLLINLSLFTLSILYTQKLVDYLNQKNIWDENSGKFVAMNDPSTISSLSSMLNMLHSFLELILYSSCVVISKQQVKNKKQNTTLKPPSSTTTGVVKQWIYRHLMLQSRTSATRRRTRKRLNKVAAVHHLKNLSRVRTPKTATGNNNTLVNDTPRPRTTISTAVITTTHFQHRKAAAEDVIRHRSAYQHKKSIRNKRKKKFSYRFFICCSRFRRSLHRTILGGCSDGTVTHNATVRVRRITPAIQIRNMQRSEVESNNHNNKNKKNNNTALTKKIIIPAVSLNTNNNIIIKINNNTMINNKQSLSKTGLTHHQYHHTHKVSDAINNNNIDNYSFSGFDTIPSQESSDDPCSVGISFSSASASGTLTSSGGMKSKRKRTKRKESSHEKLATSRLGLDLPTTPTMKNFALNTRKLNVSANNVVDSRFSLKHQIHHRRMHKKVNNLKNLQKQRNEHEYTASPTTHGSDVGVDDGDETVINNNYYDSIASAPSTSAEGRVVATSSNSTSIATVSTSSNTAHGDSSSLNSTLTGINKETSRNN